MKVVIVLEQADIIALTKNVHVCICVNIDMHICIRVCIIMYVFVYMYIYMCMNTNECIHPYACLIVCISCVHHILSK